jgi:hypothetical protein
MPEIARNLGLQLKGSTIEFAFIWISQMKDTFLRGRFCRFEYTSKDSLIRRPFIHSRE